MKWIDPARHGGRFGAEDLELLHQVLALRGRSTERAVRDFARLLSMQSVGSELPERCLSDLSLCQV